MEKQNVRGCQSGGGGVIWRGRALGAVAARLVYTKTGISWTHWLSSAIKRTDGPIPLFPGPMNMAPSILKSPKFLLPGVTNGGDKIPAFEFSGSTGIYLSPARA